MERKKFIFNLSAPVKIIAAAFFILSFSACFSPWDGGEGTLSFNFGGDNSARHMIDLDSEEYKNYIHEVILKNLDGEIVLQDKFSGKTGIVSIHAGTYTVTIKGYDTDGVLHSYGIYSDEAKEKHSITVTAGKNEEVPVKMHSAAEVFSWEEIRNVVEEAVNGASEYPERELYILINSEELAANETITVSSARITLVAEHSVTIDASAATPIFNISSNNAGVVLTLGIKNMPGEITITGNSGGADGALINVRTGTLTMHERVFIKGHRNSSANGSNGGAVFVSDGGTFEMYGGEISGNTANYGGGVYVSRGNFLKHKTGGEIFDNTAEEEGQAVYAANDNNDNSVYNYRDSNVDKHEELSCSYQDDEFTFIGKWEKESITYVPVTGVQIEHDGKHIDSFSLSVGEHFSLTANVMPDNATNKNVTWTSSNPDVVTVKEGYIKAIIIGETTITVTTEDGNLSANCTVKVTEAVEDLNIIEIDTAEKFGNIGFGNYPADGHYILINNIEYDTALGITSTFTGIFDGNGKKITLKLNNTSTTNANIGLFAEVGEGATIKNLILEGVIEVVSDTKISQHINVGAVTGQLTNGTIENVSSNVKIIATNSSTAYSLYSGGITGSNSGIITNCYSTGDITASSGSTGNSRVGGIAGNNNGNIFYCWTSGNIIAASGNTRHVGGISGYFQSGYIENCIVISSEIKSTVGTNVGRIIGYKLDSNSSLKDNYTWIGTKLTKGTSTTTSISTNANSEDGASLWTDEIITKNVWESAGFSFGSNFPWEWNDDGMPTLFDEEKTAWPSSDNMDLNIGMTGASATAAFRIYNETTLQKVGKETGSDKWTLDASYVQIRDITLPTDRDWEPIGNNIFGPNSAAPFTGTYDGGGYTIENITFKVASPDNRGYGFFGYIGENGKVQNVGLVNVNFESGAYVGGIAGLNDGTVQNCFTVSGKIIGTGTIGGVVGHNEGTVQYCYSNVSIECSGGGVGGIVGNNVLRDSCIVSNCVALNTSLSGLFNYGRVIGANAQTEAGKYINNYARNDWTLSGEGAFINGTNMNPSLKTDWENAGFDFSSNSIWNWSEGKLPYMKTTF